MYLFFYLKVKFDSNLCYFLYTNNAIKCRFTTLHFADSRYLHTPAMIVCLNTNILMPSLHKLIIFPWKQIHLFSRLNHYPSFCGSVVFVFFLFFILIQFCGRKHTGILQIVGFWIWVNSVLVQRILLESAITVDFWFQLISVSCIHA